MIISTDTECLTVSALVSSLTPSRQPTLPHRVTMTIRWDNATQALSTLPGTTFYPTLAVGVGKIAIPPEEEQTVGTRQTSCAVSYGNHCWFLPTSPSGMFRSSFAPHFSGKALSPPFPTGVFTPTHPLTQRPGARMVLGTHSSYKLKIAQLNGGDAGGRPDLVRASEL